MSDGATDRPDPALWRTCAVVLLGPLMAQLDSTVVNVSLSRIQQALGATIGTVQWVIGAYLLALALVLPLNAWLVDRLGAKRLYLWCFSAFTLASFGCGAATTIHQLIAARVLQGAAGGLLAPMAQMMIARVAGRHMARVIGYSAMPVLLAPILGPSVAGAVLNCASWPWLFYINLPIGVVAVVLAALLLPRDLPSTNRRAFDFAGFALISPGLALLLYGLDHAPHPQGLATMAAGALLLAAFVRHARRKEAAALLDLRLFTIRTFARATATQLLSNASIYAGQLLVPLYLIAGCGLSPAAAGLVLAPMGLGMLCVYPSMGFLTERFGCRAVAAAGAALTLAATLPMLWMSQAGFSTPLMVLCLLARGAGQGAIGVPSISAGYASVPRDKLALATTAANIVQRLGGPIGTTVLAIVIAASEARLAGLPGGGGAAVFTPAFAALALLQLLVLVSTLRLPLRVHPPAVAATATG